MQASSPVCLHRQAMIDIFNLKIGYKIFNVLNYKGSNSILLSYMWSPTPPYLGIHRARNTAAGRVQRRGVATEDISVSEMAKTIVLLAVLAYASAESYSASRLVQNIYRECLSEYSIACVRPRTLEWMARVANDDEIKITEDLTIYRTGVAEESEVDPRFAKDPTYKILDKIDTFLDTHAVRVKVPEEITNTAASEYVPRSLLVDLPSELHLPLADSDDDEEVFEGRKKKIKLPKLKIKSKHGFVKKVIIPFLLGLKFKASVLVPLALALIALKTWKALTLSLISLVLSGAMVIFKFTKPKVVNYEVIHYPQHHVEHHVDHHAPGWDAHAPYQARSYEEAQELAYAGQM
ncbi:hypothetical protein EVAR_48348_1 [Eumeta japonica]|uniref:Osiris 18 n=1 Tax=Eumeta variegata TaxID=151549 RepID=A0A4C1WM99_EUMVA|nr:hypothetical protein EVAR_48348_1 [Eumeta japonica]